MIKTLGFAEQTTQSTWAELDGLLSVQTIQLSANCGFDLYPQVQEHRKDYYRVSAPHLLESAELAQELRIDQRSIIYSVYSNNEILASLRLTPRPFEIENFDLHEIDFNLYDGYLEIGRLVTNPKVDQLTSAMIVRYLLCVAGLKAFGELESKGFVAICRPYRASFFAKFGLRELGNIFSEQRGIVYRFLAGSVHEILSTTAQLQENETALKRRLQKTFGV